MRGSRTCGFTLLEVLVAMAIVAVAIFPLLQLVQEAEQNAFDAKFTVVAASTVKMLLSEKLALAKPGTSEEGTLADLRWDVNELVADMDFVDIYYEWEIEEVNLSEDVLAESRERAGEDADPADDTPTDGTLGEEPEIDERFRARYARITIYYALDSGDEKELTVETFLPPLPTERSGGPDDLIPPNT